MTHYVALCYIRIHKAQLRIGDSNIRRHPISLIRGICPECKSKLNLEYYSACCPNCSFTATVGILGLSTFELKALLMLASCSGKVILVYAKLRNIPISRTEDVAAHPLFSKTEYQKLLGFYNNLARKCGDISAKPEFSLNFEEMIQE